MKRFRRIVLIANGESPPLDILISEINKSDLIVAIDGGVNHCKDAHIVPDYLVGDLDSLDKTYVKKHPKIKIIKAENQDFTDLQKTLKFIIPFNPDSVSLFSVSGKRSDHSLANFIILSNQKIDYNLTIYDSFGKWSLLQPGVHKFSLPKDTIVSLISINPVKDLTLTGFRFPVKNKDYPNNFIGISNIVNENSTKIEFLMGKILFYELNS